MSRIGKLPISLDGVEVKVQEGLVSVKGKRGEAEYPSPVASQPILTAASFTLYEGTTAPSREGSTVLPVPSSTTAWSVFATATNAPWSFRARDTPPRSRARPLSCRWASATR